MKLRVGLVGLGDSWEQRHRPALRALADRFEVRAVCDQIAHRAELAATEFRAATVDGFRALAAREDIDAVLMLSPQWYGALPALAACAAGKAVYLGAGLALEPAQAELIRRRVEEAGVAFTAEFPRRHAPATLRLKELIATRLGAPRLVFCHHRLSVAARRHGPAYPHTTIGQELVELVDWCRYVVGNEPRWVNGVAQHRSPEDGREDYRMLSLDFGPTEPGNGTVAQISCGRYFPAAWHEAIAYRALAALQVCCENGIAFVDLPATLVWFDDAGRHHESLDADRPVGEYMLAQFHRAVTGNARKTSDLDDACRAMAIVEQSARSFEEGRRVEV